jgi:exoribonuclease R
MQRRVRLLPPDAADIAAAFADLRDSLDVSLGFPGDVVADAEESVRSPRLPTADETAIPFVTIDPPGSRDLDQALHLERRGGGYRVRYAIADVAAFVAPGGPMDREAHARAQTFYAPDGNARLYPPELSEGAGSLLPDETRPALVWTLDLDADGENVAIAVRRALIRSRHQLDYETVQRKLDDESADDSLLLLREVGLLRQDREARSGGVDLPIPDQEVAIGPEGYELSWRAPLPVEGWNAQISLLTGQAAAELMLGAQVGVLRTLPRADPGALARLRRTARALHVPWPEPLSHAEFIRTLDPAAPAHAAVLAETTVLFRGSGYLAFDGDAPDDAKHAGVGAAYAHATAPLRRLVDRYVGEVCVAVSAGDEIPEWARAALPELPETMERSNRRAQQYGGGIVSTVEAAVLARSVGRVFEAAVVETDEHGGVVQLTDPAVSARCEGDLPLGERVDVRLTLADVAKRQVRFQLAERSGSDDVRAGGGSRRL